MRIKNKQTIHNFVIAPINKQDYTLSMSSKKNNYYISKDNFERNKKAFKELLKERDFDIASMRWEQGIEIKAIAEKYSISTTRIRQLLAKVCYILHKNKYEIDGKINW